MGRIRPLNEAIFIFLEEIGFAEIKHAEKRIVVEVVYKRIEWSDVPGPSLLVS